MESDVTHDAGAGAATQDRVETPPSGNQAAIAAVRAHHAELAAQLRTLTAATLDTAQTGQSAHPRNELHAWYRDRLMPHIVAEEAAFYGPAADLEATRLLVRGMLADHKALVALIAELAMARTGFAAATTAASAQALFTTHLDKENDLLLPALDQAGFDLPALLAGMHDLLGVTDASTGHDCGCSHEPVGQPVSVQIGSPDELDVRTLPHGQRHEVIFARLDSLVPGESLVIVNDHDPKPLRYQTEALWPDRFTWTYRDTGPHVWRVAITRAS
jgi:uncharacterized protein (DUF2249 family)